MQGALSCLQVNSQALMYYFCFTFPFSCACQRPQSRSEPLALAAGCAQEAGVVQGEGFARQQRLALLAGKVLLVPGQPFCLLVVL